MQIQLIVGLGSDADMQLTPRDQVDEALYDSKWNNARLHACERVRQNLHIPANTFQKVNTKRPISFKEWQFLDGQKLMD